MLGPIVEEHTKMEKSFEILDGPDGERRQNVLNMIGSYERKNFDGITSREVISGLGRGSPTTIYEDLKKLKENKFIISDDNRRKRDAKYALSLSYKKNVNYFKGIPKLDMNVVEDIIENDGNLPKPYDCMTDIQGFRAVATNLADNINESFYATCIYPPQFWLAGNFLFNWDKLKRESRTREDQENFIDAMNKNYGTNISTIIEWKPRGSKILEARYSKTQSICINIGEGTSAILKFGSEGKKVEAVKRTCNDGTNIFSGDPEEIEYYQRYLDKINKKDINKNKKMRIFITGVSGSIDDWKKRPGYKSEIIEDYVTNFNNNITLHMASKKSVRRLYMGDLMIVDEKFVLKYDDEAGYLILFKGGESIKKYMELFNAHNRWKNPYRFWKLKDIT